MTHEAVTLDHILSLPVGRELDAMVAERVMGLLVVKERWPLAWHTGKALSRDPEDVALWRDCLFIGSQTNSEGDRHIVPHYSTSIAAAWEVVEKLRRSFTVEIHAYHEPDSGGNLFYVKLLNILRWDRSEAPRGRGSTAPLAIVRAALKAVMG